MTGVIATIPKYQFSNALGVPMVNGTLEVYVAGTTTPTNTWQNQALSTLNTNPIVLDSRGECVLWLDSTVTYKFVLKNAEGTTQWTIDNITNSTAFAQALDTQLRADLAASSGSGLIGFLQSGTGAVERTAQAKIRDSVNVLDFGADPTGVASSVAAFNAALLAHRNVEVTAGTYNLNNKVSMTVDGTTLRLGNGVTLNLSGVAAVQSPFGNQIHCIANNCAVIGSGALSLLQITGGSQANAVGVLHKSGFLVRDLVIDGAKSGASAIADDTFMSGVSIVCTAAGGATTDCNATVDNCEIRNFLQHGVNIYGEFASGTKVINCTVTDNGKTGDALSLGTGIVVTRGVNNVCISNNVMKGQKADGFFGSSAGLASSNWTITGNVAKSNGASGISIYEEPAYASVNNVGVSEVVIAGNNCSGNARSGIRLNADTLGFVKYTTITGNSCVGNTYYGIETNSTNTTPNIVTNTVMSGNVLETNGTANVLVGAFTQKAEGYPQAFTPVVQGTTVAGVGTYSSQVGSAVKIGNVVTFQLLLDWSAHTGTGDIRISGFPYASAVPEPISVNAVWANGLTITGQGFLNILPNQIYGDLGAINNGTFSPVAIDTAATLRITGSYICA